MGTVIYCDRVKHIVEDAWDVVSHAIENVELDPIESAAGVLAPGFIAVTRVGDDHQTYLRASAITSFYREDQVDELVRREFEQFPRTTAAPWSCGGERR